MAPIASTTGVSSLVKAPEAVMSRKFATATGTKSGPPARIPLKDVTNYCEEVDKASDEAYGRNLRYQTSLVRGKALDSSIFKRKRGADIEEETTASTVKKNKTQEIPKVLKDVVAGFVPQPAPVEAIPMEPVGTAATSSAVIQGTSIGAAVVVVDEDTEIDGADIVDITFKTANPTSAVVVIDDDQYEITATSNTALPTPAVIVIDDSEDETPATSNTAPKPATSSPAVTVVDDSKNETPGSSKPAPKIAPSPAHAIKRKRSAASFEFEHTTIKKSRLSEVMSQDEVEPLSPQPEQSDPAPVEPIVEKEKTGLWTYIDASSEEEAQAQDFLADEHGSNNGIEDAFIAAANAHEAKPVKHVKFADSDGFSVDPFQVNYDEPKKPNPKHYNPKVVLQKGVAAAAKAQKNATLKAKADAEKTKQELFDRAEKAHAHAMGDAEDLKTEEEEEEEAKKARKEERRQKREEEEKEHYFVRGHRGPWNEGKGTQFGWEKNSSYIPWATPSIVGNVGIFTDVLNSMKRNGLYEL